MDSEQDRAGEALLAVFERIYVINLPERADRRAELDRQFRRIGLSLDHPAIEIFPAVRPADPGGFPNIGARGCFLSHLGILEKALGDGVERFLIMEDDADFSSDFPSRFAGMAEQLEAEDWAFFYGWTDDSYHKRGRADDTRVQVVAPAQVIRLTHFIGVTGQAAAAMVPYFKAILGRPLGDPEGGPMHVDGAYSWFRAAHPGLGTLAPHFPLAVQRPSRSDIHAPKWFDRLPVLRPVIDRLRRLKRALR